MAQLVLLVVAAAWGAVLIPPMLRSRVENRPNSSVTDFRRQLNKLQSSATPSRGAIRPIGRPLAASPLQRPAAAGRPGAAHVHHAHHAHHRQAVTRSTSTTARHLGPRGAEGRFRTHGGPGAEQERSHQRSKVQRPDPRRDAAKRREPVPHQIDPRTAMKRRRMNVLFALVVASGCTLFLAATTTTAAMPWIFATTFLALCGYVYLLAQLRQRESADWQDGWLERH